MESRSAGIFTIYSADKSARMITIGARIVLFSVGAPLDRASATSSSRFVVAYRGVSPAEILFFHYMPFAFTSRVYLRGARMRRSVREVYNATLREA